MASSPTPSIDKQFVAQLVGQAEESGVAIDGENRLLAELPKLVVESTLEGEITDHLGYDKHAKGGSSDGNSRNGTPAKTVTTGGRVEIDVPPGPGWHVHTRDHEEAATPPREHRRSRPVVVRARHDPW